MKLAPSVKYALFVKYEVDWQCNLVYVHGMGAILTESFSIFVFSLFTANHC